MLELDLKFLDEEFEEFERIEIRARDDARNKGKRYTGHYTKQYVTKPFIALAKFLAKKIQAKTPGAQLSDRDAFEILRREHIKYLSKQSAFSQEGVKREFDVEFQKYESTQIPMGDEFRICYYEWEQGVRAFREHKLTTDDDKGNKKTLIKYHHHSSPVSSGIPNFADRIATTEANFKQVVADLGGKPVTEIRLLSTNKRLGGGNYKEVLETYLAAIRCDQPLNIFFYGVNFARFLRPSVLLPKWFSNLIGYEGGLQTWINTRSTNELFEKVFKKLNIGNLGLEKIKEQRIELQKKIKDLNLTKGAKAIEKKFLELLREHQKVEKELLEKYKTLWKKRPPGVSTDEEQAIIEDLNTFFQLIENNRYVSSTYNGQIQATLVRLNRRLDEQVVTGCYDAKDRDGMVSIVVEANEIYKETHGHYPDISAEGKKGSEIRKELKKIQNQVCMYSTAAPVAEQVSWPKIAKGLDNTQAPLSGFGRLPNEVGVLAGIFKKVYGHAKPKKLEYKIKEAKKEPKYVQELIIKKAGEEKGKLRVKRIISLVNGEFRICENPTENERIEIKDSTSHYFRVFNHGVSYHSHEKLQPEVLKEMVGRIVKEVINACKPQKMEDLEFTGSDEMLEIARPILEKYFNNLNPSSRSDKLVLNEDLRKYLQVGGMREA
jgi:hypothetical protein